MTDQPPTTPAAEPTLAEVLAAIKVVGARLGAVEQRLTAVETRMSSVELRLLTVEDRMDQTKAAVGDLTDRVCSVEKTVEEFGVALGAALQQLGAIRDHLGIPAPKPV